MNSDTKLEGSWPQPLPPISAEEFDAKFDAGEDVSGYFDWDRAVMVEPGELSPGQKLSLIHEMLEDLMASMDTRAFFSPAQMNLSVPLSPITLVEVDLEAARHGISREELVQSWIEQKLVEQKAAK